MATALEANDGEIAMNLADDIRETLTKYGLTRHKYLVIPLENHHQFSMLRNLRQPLYRKIPFQSISY